MAQAAGEKEFRDVSNSLHEMPQVPSWQPTVVSNMLRSLLWQVGPRYVDRVPPPPRPLSNTGVKILFLRLCAQSVPKWSTFESFA